MSYDTRLYLQKYLVQQFDPLLANSFQLVAGSNITLTPSGTSLTIASTASGSGGGSVTSFSAGNLSPLFTTSVATATTTPALSFTIAQAASGTFAAGPVSGANANIALRALATSDLPVGIPATKIGAGTVDDLEFGYLDGVTSAIQTQFAGKAANTEAFVTLGNTSGLTNERALTVAGGLTIQDNGVNSSVVVSASALQPLDPTLTALAAYNTNGFVTQTGTDTFAGRTLAAGGGLTIQEAGSVITISGSAINGTVTSVAQSVPATLLSVSGSPITTAGTLALSLVNQTSGTAFLGPVSGAAATPTWRSITTADLPSTVGTVQSVALSLPSIITVSGSPVTTSGTLTGTLATQPSGTVFAGPTSGANATPAFRALVTADLPAGTGTVTSVAQSVPASLLSISGSPITTAGTLAIGLTNAASGTFWAGPTSGAATTPAYRAIVAGDLPSTVAYTNAANSWSTAQLPNAAGTIDLGSTALPFRNIILGGAATNNTKLVSATTTAQRTVTFPDADSNSVVPDTGAANNFLTAISAAGVISKAQPAFSNISGTAAATQGGTAQSTYTTGDILYASASNTLSKLSIGSTNQVLTVAAGIPSWAAAGGGSSNLTIVGQGGNFTANGSSNTLYLITASSDVTSQLVTSTGAGKVLRWSAISGTSTITIAASGSDTIQNAGQPTASPLLMYGGINAGTLTLAEIPGGWLVI